MKKIIMLLMAAVLMLGVSGQAMAAFNEGDLIRVVYSSAANGTGTEYATDLGNFSTLTSPLTANNPLTGRDSFSLSSVGATNWSDVQVAYFIADTSANNYIGAAWTSGPQTGGGYTNTYAYWGGLMPAYNSTTSNYQVSAGSASSVAFSQANPYSYWNNFNGGGTQIGTMGGYLDPLKAGNTAEANLGALSTASYVDQVLYYYADPDSGNPGTGVATLRTFADGHTELVAATPIPAAAYLFGTGLLGLAGIRRKMVV